MPSTSYAREQPSYDIFNQLYDMASHEVQSRSESPHFPQVPPPGIPTDLSSLHVSFQYLEILLRTLGQRVTAVRFDLKSIYAPLSYENVILCDALAVPIDLDVCVESVRRFLAHNRRSEILYYCVANNVTGRRLKNLGPERDALVAEVPESTEKRLGVESMVRQLSVIVEGHLGDIHLDPQVMGDPITSEQIRLELYRAVLNFLFRHLFWRYVPGDKPLKIPKSRERGQLVYLLESSARKVQFSASFKPMDAKSSRMDKHKKHTLRTTQDGLLHDVINNFGYGGRFDGLETALAVRMSDLGLLDVLSVTVNSGPPPISFNPFHTLSVFLPTILRLRTLLTPWCLPARWKNGAMTPHMYGDTVESMIQLLACFKDQLGIQSLESISMVVPPWAARDRRRRNMQAGRVAQGEEIPATSPASSQAVSLGIEIRTTKPLDVPSLFRQLEYLLTHGTHVVPRHVLPSSGRSVHLSQAADGNPGEGGGGDTGMAADNGACLDVLGLSNTTLFEHLIAFGVGIRPTWAADVRSKLPSFPEGAALLTEVRQAGANSDVGDGDCGDNRCHDEVTVDDAEFAFVVTSLDDLLCLAHNILIRAAIGYVPLDLLKMMLTVHDHDLVAALSAPCGGGARCCDGDDDDEGGEGEAAYENVEDTLENRADIFLSLEEVLLRCIQHHGDSAVEDAMLDAEAQAKTAESEVKKHGTTGPPPVQHHRSTRGGADLQSQSLSGSPGRSPSSFSPTTNNHRSNRSVSPEDVPLDALQLMPTLSEIPLVDEIEEEVPQEPEATTIVFDDLYDRCEVWIALARNVILTRTDVRLSNDVLATAALRFLTTACGAFQHKDTEEYPLRDLLLRDVELREHLHGWSTELVFKDRVLRSRCASKDAGRVVASGRNLSQQAIQTFNSQCAMML